MELITAEVAAGMLGISKRMLYDLAAPNGPIPCIRYSVKCVRFDLVDVRAYADSCKCEPRDLVKEAGRAYVGSVALKASSPDSELLKLYRQAGTAPKPRPSTKHKK
jgi:predicted DNA-binding transcriptional regulator AlpA